MGGERRSRVNNYSRPLQIAFALCGQSHDGKRRKLHVHVHVHMCMHMCMFRTM